MGFKFVGPHYVFESTVHPTDDGEYWQFNIRSTFRVSRDIEWSLFQHHDLHSVPTAYAMLHPFHRTAALAEGSNYYTRRVTEQDMAMSSESEGETGCDSSEEDE